MVYVAAEINYNNVWAGLVIPIDVIGARNSMKLGAKACINRNEFDHWGMLPHWKDNAGYAKWLKGVRAFGAKIWEVFTPAPYPLSAVA